jgi:hypothetical protein
MTIAANVCIPQSTYGTCPSTIYAAVFSGDPAAGGVEISAIIDSGRKTVAALAAAGSVTWTQNGVATHFAYFDAPTDGNRLYSEQLAQPATFSQGDAFTFEAGNRLTKAVAGA